MDLLSFLLCFLLAGGLVPLGFIATAAGCCCVVCPCCSAGVPNQVQLDISGVANAACTGCAAWNGTWVLTKATTNCFGFTPNPAVVCFWIYQDSTTGPICAAGENGADGSDGICMGFFLNCTTPTNHEWQAYYRNAGTYAAIFGKNINPGTLGTCHSWSAYELINLVGLSAPCGDGSAATVTVTTL